MFGSIARDEAGTIPTLIDHEKGKLGLFKLMDVRDRAPASSATRLTP